jgi:hypothetical protein
MGCSPPIGRIDPRRRSAFPSLPWAGRLMAAGTFTASASCLPLGDRQAVLKRHECHLIRDLAPSPWGKTTIFSMADKVETGELNETLRVFESNTVRACRENTSWRIRAGHGIDRRLNECRTSSALRSQIPARSAPCPYPRFDTPCSWSVGYILQRIENHAPCYGVATRLEITPKCSPRRRPPGQCCGFAPLFLRGCGELIRAHCAVRVRNKLSC